MGLPRMTACHPLRARLVTSTIYQSFSRAQSVRNPLRRGSYATNSNVVADTPSSASTNSPPSWEIKMLYDGECPLCMREVEMLMRRDQGKNKIQFVDIADPGYDPKANANISYQQAMERIHAVLPDGTIVQNVEVFRRLYEVVGLGWVYSITKIPAVERAANAVYDIWAKYRLPVTGRDDLSVVLQQKEKACKASPEGGCEVSPSKE